MSAVVSLPVSTFSPCTTLQSVLLALVYNRSQGNIQGCKFQQVSKSPTLVRYVAEHKVPLPLKIMLPKVKKVIVDEDIMIEPNGLKVVSRSRETKPLSICSETTYQLVDGIVHVSGSVHMKLWEKELPKIMRSTFKRFSISKSLEVRKLEQETALKFI